MYLYRVLKLDLYGRRHLMRDMNFADFILQLVLLIMWQHYVVWQLWLERFQDEELPSAVTVVLTLAVVGLRY